MPIHLDQVKQGAILEHQQQALNVAGDVFGKGRPTVVLAFEITEGAVVIDLPDELMAIVKPPVVEMAIDEHIMAGLAGSVEHPGLHGELHVTSLFGEVAICG